MCLNGVSVVSTGSLILETSRQARNGYGLPDTFLRFRALMTKEFAPFGYDPLVLQNVAAASDCSSVCASADQLW